MRPVQRPSASKCTKKKSPTLAWRRSTSSTARMPALTSSAHGWPWGSAVVPVAAALVGSVCIITTHRRATVPTAVEPIQPARVALGAWLTLGLALASVIVGTYRVWFPNDAVNQDHHK